MVKNISINAIPAFMALLAMGLCFSQGDTLWVDGDPDCPVLDTNLQVECVGGKREGIAHWKGTNGDIIREVRYRNGKRLGAAKEFNAAHVMTNLYYYDVKSRLVSEKHFNQKGTLFQEVVYFPSKDLVLDRQYFPNGKVEFEFAREAKLNQEQIRRYYPSGTLLGVYQSTGGKLAGDLVEFNTDGSISRAGPAMGFYPDGKLK